MTDTRGLLDKFTVWRNDGKSEPGQKHDGCKYFVLDLTHDPFAWPALRAYADACRASHPGLAADLDTMIAVKQSDEKITEAMGEVMADVGQHCSDDLLLKLARKFIAETTP